MIKNKTQIQRLIFIDRMIRQGMTSGRLANCQTIAAAYEVSYKSIMRDIDYLKNQCDAPIRYDPKRYGFYFTEENYQLPAINISESDLFAIYIARQAMAQHKNTPIYRKLVSVFSKIEESLPERISISPAWIDNRISVFSGSQTDIDPLIWDTVAEALQHFRRLQISYRKTGSKNASEREVDPYHAVSFQGEWYLIGFCHLRQEIRVFAVSRIVQASKQNIGFTIPAEFTFESFTDSHFGIFTSEQHYEVKINFSAQHAPYVLERQWHRNQTIKKHQDGGLTLSFTTNHLFEVKRWILSWGSGVEALAPAELRADIHQELQKALQAYA
ncbi:MAG: WYL domain-containing protein [Thermodesulfobacteriota bacterium]